MKSGRGKIKRFLSLSECPPTRPVGDFLLCQLLPEEFLFAQHPVGTFLRIDTFAAMKLVEHEHNNCIQFQKSSTTSTCVLKIVIREHHESESSRLAARCRDPASAPQDPPLETSLSCCAPQEIVNCRAIAHRPTPHCRSHRRAAGVHRRASGSPRTGVK